MSAADTEKRSVPRNALTCPIEFVLEDNEELGTLTAEVMNIGDSGIRIYLGYELCEGQEIVVSDRLPNGCQRYKVRWSNKLTENFFEVGLKSLQ
jgi:hypothetical protein